MCVLENVFCIVEPYLKSFGDQEINALKMLEDKDNSDPIIGNQLP